MRLAVASREQLMSNKCWTNDEGAASTDGLGRPQAVGWRGAVVAVFAGHLHRGGYAVDALGVHHVPVQSPLNFDECFGWCDWLLMGD